MKRFLFICLCLFAGVVCGDDMTQLIKQLRSAGADQRMKAREGLIAHGEAAVKALHAFYFADVERLLKDLGADKFKTRRKATETLIALGGRSHDAVRKAFETTTDPEVKFRCKKILGKIKKDALNGGLEDAMETVLRIGAAIPESAPFVDHYFSKFPKVGEDRRLLLESAVKLTKNNDHLTAVLPKLKKDSHVKLVLTAIRQRMPEQAPTIIKEYEDLVFERSLDVEPLVTEMDEWNSYGNDSFEKIAKRLESQKLFDRKRPILVKKLLTHRNLRAKALGMRLARNDIKPYLPLIVKQLSEFKSDPDPMLWFFDGIKDVDRHFYPHLQVFLNSPVADIRIKGIRLCAVDPEKHKNDVLNLYRTADDYSLAQDSCKFLLRHFPGIRDQLTREAVQRIKRCNHEQGAIINSFSHVLKDRLEYAGHDLDGWWKQWSSAKGVSGHRALEVGARINVSGDTMLELALTTNSLNAQTLEHVIQTTKKDKKVILKQFLPRIGKSVPHYGSLDRVILKEMPNLFDSVFPAIMERVAKENEFQISFHSILDRYAKLVAQKPARLSLVRPYLTQEKWFIRYYAACIVLKVTPTDAKARAVFQITPNGNEHFRSAVLKSMFEFDIDFALMKPLMDTTFRKANDEHWSIRHIVDALGPRLKPNIGYFHEKLRMLNKKGYQMNALQLAEGLLQIDEGDVTAIKHLTNLAKSGPDTDNAAMALDVLSRYGRDPELSLGRLEHIYSTCDEISRINTALGNSKRNSAKAIPIVKKYVKRNLEKSWNELDELTWENEAYQRALTPELIKALKSDFRDVRNRALSTLTAGSVTLKNHLDDLKTFYATADVPARRSFMWMLANMETDASPLAPMIKKDYEKSTGDDKSHYLFAMSRIAPKKEDRLAYTKAFITHMATFPGEKKRYRMLRLIQEFPEVTFPILRDVLKQRNKGNRYEAVWGLIKEKPFTPETLATFTLLFKRCQKGTVDYDDVAENLCWALQQRVADARQFLPLLKNAHPKLRQDKGYRTLVRKIRKHQLESGAK